MSFKEKMTAIAVAIRNKTGKAEKLGLDAMAVGVGEVYEAGKQAEYDRFWDAFQNNGNKNIYDQTFAYNNWTEETYNPKYDILCVNSSVAGRQTFNNFVALTDIKVPIRATNTRIVAMFSGCTKLKTIPLLELNGVTDFNTAFSNCNALENITIAGTIEINISFANSSLLTDASVQSIIDHLKDLTGATAQTLTFHADVGAKLTDVQKAAITARNWTLVY